MLYERAAGYADRSKCDSGVSFRSSVSRQDDFQITAMSNTTSGAWPVLKDIDAALGGADTSAA